MLHEALPHLRQRHEMKLVPINYRHMVMTLIHGFSPKVDHLNYSRVTQIRVKSLNAVLGESCSFSYKWMLFP